MAAARAAALLAAGAIESILEAMGAHTANPDLHAACASALASARRRATDGHEEAAAAVARTRVVERMVGAGALLALYSLIETRPITTAARVSRARCARCLYVAPPFVGVWSEVEVWEARAASPPCQRRRAEQRRRRR